jgi:choice-of-anchor B domain-containing protein
MLKIVSFVLLCFILLVRGNYVDNDYSYALGALSNFPYRRLAIPYQHQAMMNACALLMEYGPDIMIIDCALEQLLGTSDLVVAGLTMANNTADPTQQAAGYALLDQVSSVVFSGAPMLPLNDIWGYDDPITGRSYALIGASNGVHIVDVTVPISPVSVFFLQGAYSLWRDVKVWNSTLYAVNDNNFGSLLSRFPNVNQSYIQPWLQQDGLVIIDLTYALQPTTAIKNNSIFYTAHNIQVEHDWTNVTAPCEWCRPFAYAVGVGASPGNSLQRGGFVILDLTDRLAPTVAGVWDTTYIHDIVVQFREVSPNNNTWKFVGYAAAIYSIAGKTPGLYFIDVSDPANPVTLASYNTSYNYTHNCWPTDDGTFLYVTHEQVNSPITIWNITDIYHAVEVGKLFITPENDNIVAHNVHVRGNRLWISYYAIGTAVYDITDPVNPILYGVYDTSPDIKSGMGGTWGVYPYAENYLVYASDMSNGMFVLNLTTTPVNVGPRGPAGPEITGGVLAFFIISAIVHAISIIAIFLLVFRVCASPRYRAM